MDHLGARVVALDVVVLQPSLHSLFQIGHVHLEGQIVMKKTSHVKLGLSHRALVRDYVACYQDGDLLGDYVGKVHQRRPVGE